jgi:tetratricopeptide (TPR) repeat protein
MKKSFLIILILVIVILAVGYFSFDFYQERKNIKQINLISQDFNAGNLDQAIDRAQTLVESNKTQIKISGLLSLASSYSQKGSLEFKEIEYGTKAIEIANQVLALDANNADAYKMIGYANEIMQNYDQAFIAYNKASELNPKDADVFSYIGHAYSLLGDNEKAEENYLKAVALDGKSGHTFYNLARLYYGQGNISKAEEYALKTVTSSVNNRFLAEAYDLLGLLKLGSEDFIGAMENFNLAITADPKLSSAYVHLATAKTSEVTKKMFGGDLISLRASRSKVLAEAFLLVDTALSINPNLTIAIIKKSELLSLDAKYDEALSVLATAVVSNDITLSSADKIRMKKEIEFRIGIINSLKLK